MRKSDVGKPRVEWVLALSWLLAGLLGAGLLGAGQLGGARAEAAEAAGPYQPAGAPADPRVAVQWNRYHDYAEATRLLKELARAHPQRARLKSLGRSYGGREMWLLTVTSFKHGEDRHKPAFWIDGGIHANEIQGPEVVLYTAWYLLEMYGRNEFITRLVDERTFYLLPMMSPDGRDAHMHEPHSTNSPRSGLRPVDDDRDGLVDEDGPDDLDGDGQITQMRVRDPNGRYKPHADYPDLMIRAEQDEPGQYRLLGSEGFDNDGDGRINEDGPGYYDPNRDWAWQWQPRYVQRGAWRYPFSVLENRMVADFVAAHPNIAGSQSYHNTGGMILHGPGTRDDPYASEDLAVYEAIARKGELILPGYRRIAVGTELYQVHGGAGDWFHQMQGIFHFANELFTSKNFFRQQSDAEGEGFAGKREAAYAFDRYLLFGGGTVAWHEVDHPQYGKVEVGGLTKNWRRQPPSFLLEEECHRNMAFTLYHADQMPKVEIQEVTERRLSPQLRQIDAVVANRRLTPTHSAADRQHHLTPPDIVGLEGDRLRVAAGMWAEDPFFRDAHPQEHEPRRLRIPNIPGMQAVYVRWLVEGEGQARVFVHSPKGGRDRRP